MSAWKLFLQTDCSSLFAFVDKFIVSAAQAFLVTFTK